jgi:heat shock protein HslJ
MKLTTKTVAFIMMAAAYPSQVFADSPPITPLNLPPITGVPMDIQGEWQVIELRDEDTGNLSSIDPIEPEMTISFRDGTFSLSAGCNGIGGDIFVRDGQHQVVGNMFSTMMLCPEEQDLQERRLWRAFPETGHYHRIGDYLYLFTDDGSLSISLNISTK